MEELMRAWVLVRAPTGKTRELVQRLKTQDFPEVREIGVVFGEHDVILLVAVKDNAQLSNLVYNRLQAIAEVESTTTYTCVHQTYWQRPGAA